MKQTSLCTVAILAGGQSRRMGTNKSFVQLDGKPIIQHVIERIQTLRLPTILITNTPEAYAPFQLPIYTDVLPGNGSLGGIYTALSYSTTPYTLCVGCDMPLLQPDLLQYLIDKAPGHDIVVPIVGTRPENLCAVYSQNISPIMRQQIEMEQLKIGLLHAKVRVAKIEETALKTIDPHMHSFMNVNTPDDLAKVQQALYDTLT